MFNRDLEEFAKRENAERKKELDSVNSVLEAENEKRRREAEALKEKMEKEKKQMQVWRQELNWGNSTQSFCF